MKKPTLSKLKSIKKKHVVVTVMVVVACLASLYLYLNQPSDEMRQLRKVEAVLSLPEHTKRSEDDRGIYEDDNYKQHSSRNITIYFSSSDKIDPVIEKLKTDQAWQNTMSYSSEVQSGQDYYSAEKKTCIQIRQNSSDQNNKIFTLVLRAPSDDECKAFFS